jgi:acyl carrier protein
VTGLQRDDVLAVLRSQLLSVNGDVPTDLGGELGLADDVGLDSLDIVEFVARVEEHYRVSVPDEDWQSLTTLDAIADYVLAHQP